MSELDQQVSQIIERARKERRLRPEALCVAADLSRASYYNRLTSGGWRIKELEALAPILNLVISVSESAWTRRWAGQRGAA